MPADFEVRTASEHDLPAVLAALGDGYGRPFMPEWFEWKHRSSPWGASRCYTAVDDGGLLGVVFGLPWPVLDDGVPGTLVRLVDGATTVRAQRRGVFRAVVRTLLDDAGIGEGGRGALALATATPEARAAHVKNGAVVLAPIRACYRPVRWSSARLVEGDSVLDSFVVGAGGVRTRWEGSSLRWRLDARSGAPATAAALASADVPHGVIHRAVGAGSRKVVVVVATWGPSDVVDRTIRALARREKALVVLENRGPGTDRRMPRVSLRRGASLMCVWDDRPDTPPAFAAERWHLSGLDLEGTI